MSRCPSEHICMFRSFPYNQNNLNVTEKWKYKLYRIQPTAGEKMDEEGKKRNAKLKIHIQFPKRGFEAFMHARARSLRIGLFKRTAQWDMRVGRVWVTKIRKRGKTELMGRREGKHVIPTNGVQEHKEMRREDKGKQFRREGKVNVAWRIKTN